MCRYGTADAEKNAVTVTLVQDYAVSNYAELEISLNSVDAVEPFFNE